MHVAVTGASSGIGKAIATEFVASGASVTAVARRTELLEELRALGGKRVFAKSVDLLDLEASVSWVAEAERALGPIDVLVNNAGMQIIAPTDLTDREAGERVLRLNLLSPFRITRALLPAMRARRSGVIVDIASVAALAPMPGTHDYNASKAGLAAASEALRGELRGTGVHVVTVYPGPVRTPMGESADRAWGSTAGEMMPWGTPEALAKRVRAAVERRRDRVIYPRIYALARHFPALARLLTDRFTPRLPRP